MDNWWKKYISIAWSILNMDLESLKWDEHNLDLYRIERRLEEYMGLKSEREIKIEEDYLRVCRNLKLVFFEDNSPERGTDDWDFTGWWTLNTSIYVSPPASVEFGDHAGALCKVTETLDIPEGRLVFYVRHADDWHDTYTTGWNIHFRVNDDVGGFSVDGSGFAVNGYTVHTWVHGYSVELWEGGSKVTGKGIISAPHANQWGKYRVTFWISEDVLIVRKEWYDGGAEEWKKMIDDLTDVSPTFEEPNNRVGIGNRYWYNSWFDDIEIWKRI
ncbi:MAG: hypothetical protein DRN91_06920 [Candidatus Alkanophagales archaeon]|nr:MAG: hypothetical protein DRN91_06920 [Candidatus Alkanophagales archaeon]